MRRRKRERMLATGRFPALAKVVYDGTEVDAETSFTTGLDWVLDAVAAKIAPPAGAPARAGAPEPDHGDALAGGGRVRDGF